MEVLLSGISEALLTEGFAIVVASVRHLSIHAIVLEELLQEGISHRDAVRLAAAVGTRLCREGYGNKASASVTNGYVDELVLPAQRPAHRTEGLSRRELRVLLEAGQGKTNKEIADTLCLSRRTVERHFENIFLKLGVRRRTAAIRLALAYDAKEPARG